MDIYFFLQQRTKFIRYFYETASSPFYKIMADIEAEVEPYIPPYSEDSEPAFLSEWIDAKTGSEMCGLHALSMISSSLHLYLKNWLERLKSSHEVIGVNFKSKGWFSGYREIFDECGLDVGSCPVNFDLIEQITLARNRVQHPEKITFISVFHSDSDLKKYPNPYFVQDIENSAIKDGDAQWLFPPTVAPSQEHVFEAIDNVNKLCEWLEHAYWDSIAN
ncbi:hypothetical protein ACTWWB_004311 [Vibrio fluvialis]